MYGRNLVYPRTTNNNLFLLSPIRVCVCLGNVECITTQFSRAVRRSRWHAISP